MSEDLSIPKGATHFIPAEDTAYSQKIEFMKWGYNFTGPESGKAFYCWFNLHQGDWHKDTSFVDRHNKLKPIEEFNEYYGIEQPVVSKVKPR